MRFCVALAAAIACFAATAGFLGGTAATDAQGRVTALNLRSTWIDDSDLLEIAKLDALTDLDLSATRITDIGFQALRKLKNVSRVNLYYAEQIGDGALAAMREWKQLRHVNLRGTKVTDAGLAHLASLPVESLDAGYSLFTDNGFDQVVNLTQLKRLAVGGNKVTDAGLNSLRLLPNLTELDLSGAQRTDSGIWAATITDRSIETLDFLTNLQTLNLRGSKFTDTGFAKLRQLKQLRRIDLGETNLSAQGLTALGEFPRIEAIGLYNSKNVRDDVIPILSALRNLSFVDLTGTAVTAAGVQSLKAVNSSCRVLWTGGAAMQKSR